jgi:hypothetical protein
MKDYMNKRALVTLCVLSLGSLISYGGVINYQSLPTTGTLGPMGSGANGQPIFNLPSGGSVVLDDWTFYLQNTGGTDENFLFSLLRDNGDGTDSILWTSPQQTITAADASSTAFTVHPNYALNPADNYTMFISELGQNGGADGSVLFAISPGGANPDQYGLFIYNNSTDPSGYTVQANWGAFIGAGMSYNADFTVPDGGANSFLLFGLGLGGLCAMRRRFVKA